MRRAAQLTDRLHDYRNSASRFILVYSAWLSTAGSARGAPGALGVFTMKGETAMLHRAPVRRVRRTIALRRAEVRWHLGRWSRPWCWPGRVRVSSGSCFGDGHGQQAGRGEQLRARRPTVADRLPQDVLAKLERMRREQ